MTPRQLASLVAGHQPTSPREAASRRTMLGYLQWLPRPLDEDADPVHVTGSAIVLDGRGRTLLHRHKRLGRWLQPGGHVDPGESPAQAAVREAIEETGLAVWHPDGTPRLVNVDVHEGGRGHLHLDLRYVLAADGDAPFAPAAGESPDLRWVDVTDIGAWGDTSVSEAVRAAALTIAPRGPRSPRPA